jgi:hypothetical protein
MEPLINILHLEDDPADAKLVQANLEKAGLVCRITFVQSRDQFELDLDNGAMDIILADYQQSDDDGLSALRLAKELRPGTPFIFVSVGRPRRPCSVPMKCCGRSLKRHPWPSLVWTWTDLFIRFGIQPPKKCSIGAPRR